MTDKTIGVIGGMGPEATVELMRRVIAATPASDDADHIRMIVDNNPGIPSRIKALIEGGGEDPGPVMAAMARGLETAGAEVLVIPCNTAHHYLPVVQAAVRVPVLDVVSLTASRLASLDPPVMRVGMLASPAVRLVGLFDQRLSEHGLDPHYPDEAGQSAVFEIIRAVKAAGVTEARLQAYDHAARNLVESGVDALLIACTELSVLPPPAAGVPVVDTLDVLVDAVITAARGECTDRPTGGA